MTAKEKAQELYNKMENSIFIEPDPTWEGQCKKGALIVIDEVLNYSKAHGFIGLTEYYEEIKQEIEKL